MWYGIDVIEVFLGCLMIVYGIMLVWMVDFNDKVVNKDEDK